MSSAGALDRTCSLRLANRMKALVEEAMRPLCLPGSRRSTLTVWPIRDQGSEFPAAGWFVVTNVDAPQAEVARVPAVCVEPL